LGNIYSKTEVNRIRFKQKSAWRYRVTDAWHAIEIDEVTRRLNADRNGLTSGEAE